MYQGGGVSFDEDLFGDENAGPLELDLPAAHPPEGGGAVSRGSGAVPVAQGAHGSWGEGARTSEPAVGTEADLFAAVPDAAPSAHDGVRPSGAHPRPGTSGTVPSARPQAGTEANLGGDASGSLPAASAQVAPAPRRVTAAPDLGGLVVARFPPPPAGVTGMPGYFCRVFVRRFELRRDLESLRRRRSPDVPLYESALCAHDARAYGIGGAITAMLVTLGTLLFFSPVIARFLRAD